MTTPNPPSTQTEQAPPKIDLPKCLRRLNLTCKDRTTDGLCLFKEGCSFKEVKK